MNLKNNHEASVVIDFKEVVVTWSCDLRLDVGGMGESRGDQRAVERGFVGRGDLVDRDCGR